MLSVNVSVAAAKAGEIALTLSENVCVRFPAVLDVVVVLDEFDRARRGRVDGLVNLGHVAGCVC